MASQYWVYRLYDRDGQLLYIGKSIDVDRRLAQHRSDKRSRLWINRVCKVTTEPYSNGPEAHQAEASAIRQEQPLHNVVHITQERDHLSDLALTRANARFQEIAKPLFTRLLNEARAELELPPVGVLPPGRAPVVQVSEDEGKPRKSKKGARA